MYIELVKTIEFPKRCRSGNVWEYQPAVYWDNGLSLKADPQDR